jgi:hypothetical protein
MLTRSTSVPAFLSMRPQRRRRLAACINVGLAIAVACAPATAALAHGTQTSGPNQQRQTAGQRQATPGRLTVPVTGTFGSTDAPAADSAATAVTGTFAIQRFARTAENTVAAVGTLTLTFTDTSTSATRTIITQAAMPLARSTDAPAPASAPAADRPATSALSPTTTACETLRLVLDSIAIAPLGVSLQIERVNVDLTATPGVGERLPALLCEVASQLEGTTAPAEVVNTLNTLLDMLG